MLLINGLRNLAEIKLHTSIEFIGLGSSRYAGNGTDGSLAGSNSGRGSLALVIENVANCIKDNLAVGCRSLVELGLVLWLKAVLAQCAPFKAGTLIKNVRKSTKAKPNFDTHEFDSRIGARTEIQGPRGRWG